LFLYLYPECQMEGECSFKVVVKTFFIMNILKNICLFIIPVTILLVVNIKAKTEFWKSSYDPDYCYLFNGLNLAYSHGNIGHVDHPGTTVQVLSGLIIKITYTFRKTANSLPSDLLSFPEYYLRVIAWTFTIINCIIIFFCGWIIFNLTRELSYGLLFQSFAILPLTVYSGYFHVRPEPVLFGMITIFVTLLIWKYYEKKESGCFRIKWTIKDHILFDVKLDKVEILLGFIMGFCIATKFISIPLIILPLILIPKYINKIIFLLITILSFYILTYPIHVYFDYVFIWLKNLMFHSGLYGSGGNEILNFNLFLHNFIQFVRTDPILFLIISISLVFIIRQLILKKYDIHLKFLVALFLVQVVDMIMVLKHYQSHYFFPVIPLLPLNLFIIFHMIRLSEILRLVIIIPCIVLGMVINIRGSFYNVHLRDESSVQISSTNQTNKIYMYSYGCNSQIYALKFGDDFSRNINSSLLEKLYGKQYFYDVWNKNFYNWNQQINTDTLLRMDKNIYLFADQKYLNLMKPPFELQLISEGKYILARKR